jgi:pimeloyl-ACP methyl ester carboxylesterase
MARIVFVHGAFAGAWCWEPVLEPLRSAGHTVEAIDMPSCGEDDTPASSADLDAFARKICGVLGSGPPAVLAGHSMGGMAITHAAANCPQHVTALIYVCAFAPHDGQSLVDLVAYPEAAEDQVQANLVIDGDVGILPPEGARIAMLDECSPADLRWALERLGPVPVAAWATKVTIAGSDGEAYEGLPKAYILCGKDQAIPPQMQRRMISDGSFDPVIEIDTDHWPWLSRTPEFLAAMDEILERPEFAGG